MRLSQAVLETSFKEVTKFAFRSEICFMPFRRLPSMMPLLAFALVSVVLVGVGLGWRRFGSLSQAGPEVAATSGASTGSIPAPTLPQEEREYLWQVEHSGLLLGRVGFQPLSEALKQGDAARLASLMADDFQGEVPSHPHRMQHTLEAAAVEREYDDGQPP